MDEKLLEVWSQGEVLEMFPFEDLELQPGHQEALVMHEDLVYHILVSSDGQPLKINHIASDSDYDMSDDDFADWDRLSDDGLEDYPWEEEEE